MTDTTTAQVDWMDEHPAESLDVILARRIQAARPPASDGGTVRGSCQITFDPLTDRPAERWTVAYVVGGHVKRRKSRRVCGAYLSPLLRRACADLGLPADGTPTALPFEYRGTTWTLG